MFGASEQRIMCNNLLWVMFCVHNFTILFLVFVFVCRANRNLQQGTSTMNRDDSVSMALLQRKAKCEMIHEQRTCSTNEVSRRHHRMQPAIETTRRTKKKKWGKGTFCRQTVGMYTIHSERLTTTRMSRTPKRFDAKKNTHRIERRKIFDFSPEWAWDLRPFCRSNAFFTDINVAKWEFEGKTMITSKSKHTLDQNSWFTVPSFDAAYLAVGNRNYSFARTVVGWVDSLVGSYSTISFPENVSGSQSMDLMDRNIDESMGNVSEIIKWYHRHLVKIW